MRTTKNIKAGEQVVCLSYIPFPSHLQADAINLYQFNTYGNLPNSDLLRRYGHVDLIPLSSEGMEGNPADEVEVKADLVVQVVRGTALWVGMKSAVVEKEMVERIEWWIDEGNDEYACRSIAAYISITRANTVCSYSPCMNPCQSHVHSSPSFIFSFCQMQHGKSINHFLKGKFQGLQLHKQQLMFCMQDWVNMEPVLRKIRSCGSPYKKVWKCQETNLMHWLSTLERRGS